MIYLTTDTHFGHDKMIEYCDRPEGFEEKILEGLLTIPENALLIHLGDVCIGRDKEMMEKYIKPLKCKKCLVLGNHDKKSLGFYLENGFDMVCLRVYEFRYGLKILFSHTPQADDNYYDINIHGHGHNNDHRNYEPEIASVSNSKQKLLAIEYTNYQPIKLETFLKERKLI